MRWTAKRQQQRANVKGHRRSLKSIAYQQYVNSASARPDPLFEFSFPSL